MAVRMNGKKIRALREEKLLERAELAELAGCKYTTIYKIEHLNHVPRLYTVRKLAKALKVSSDEIVERESSSLAS